MPGVQLSDGAVLKAAGAGGPPRVAGDHGSDAARLTCLQHLCVQPGADVAQPIRVYNGLQPRNRCIGRGMQLHRDPVLQLKPEVKRLASRRWRSVPYRPAIERSQRSPKRTLQPSKGASFCGCHKLLNRA